MNVSKTNAIRQIEAKKHAYELYEYEAPEGFLDGVSVAKSIGKPVEMVYKTLIAQGGSKEYYVFIIPVEMELDLKMAAKAVGEKKMDMIPAKEITNITGYIKGGCSPIGMKKPLKTVIHLSAQDLDRIVVSGGRVGLQVEIETAALLELTKGRMEYLISE
jgi:Cys-tRNA(Pro)/Cys-tRNA(Cys) deacylase